MWPLFDLSIGTNARTLLIVRLYGVATVDPELSQNLLGEFSWLQYLLFGTVSDTLPSNIPNESARAITNLGQEGSICHVPAMEEDYMFHWLEVGFALEDTSGFLL